jgi:hypothetical protein
VLSNGWLHLQTNSPFSSASGDSSPTLMPLVLAPGILRNLNLKIHPAWSPPKGRLVATTTTTTTTNYRKVNIAWTI